MQESPHGDKSHEVKHSAHKHFYYEWFNFKLSPKSNNITRNHHIQQAPDTSKYHLTYPVIKFLNIMLHYQRCLVMHAVYYWLVCLEPLYVWIFLKM